MKHVISICIVFILLITVRSAAQSFTPDWYILEKGTTVLIIKPGVNDLTLYLAASGNKPIDKAAVDSMNKRTKFAAGSVVLIYAQQGDTYIAQDMEGRNLVIKGNVTKAEQGVECTVGYLKTNVSASGASIRKATFVWIKEQIKSSNEVVIQGPDAVEIKIPSSQVYDIKATTLSMASAAMQKTVE